MNIFIHFSANTLLPTYLLTLLDFYKEEAYPMGSNKFAVNIAKQIYCHAFRQPRKIRDFYAVEMRCDAMGCNAADGC